MCQICCVFKPANHISRVTSRVTSGLISVDSHCCLFVFDCFIFSQSVLLLWVAHRCPNFQRSGSHDRKKRGIRGDDLFWKERPVQETYLNSLPGLCKGTCLQIYYVVLLLYYIASR